MTHFVWSFINWLFLQAASGTLNMIFKMGQFSLLLHWLDNVWSCMEIVVVIAHHHHSLRCDCYSQSTVIMKTSKHNFTGLTVASFCDFDHFCPVFRLISDHVAKIFPQVTLEQNWWNDYSKLDKVHWFWTRNLFSKDMWHCGSVKCEEKQDLKPIPEGSHSITAEFWLKRTFISKRSGWIW